MLRFVVDESTGWAVAEFLGASGCDVVVVADATDPTLWKQF